MKPPAWALPGLAVLFCVACAALLSSAEHARKLAESAGFAAVGLPDQHLRAFAKHAKPGAQTDLVTVYIESDGAPWRRRNEPPSDPTPIKPLVLRMSIDDPSPAVAYLGRPCQYLPEAELRLCDPELWSRGRFRDDAVESMNAAIDVLKRHYGASAINLVGYSGGGAMAALIAARRNDVNCLVTVAAPLDTRAWTDALGVSPLATSLNPADHAEHLRGVRQTHFRGLRDAVVPPATTQRYFTRSPGAAVIDKSAYDHRCCWENEWKELLRASCLSP
jgi:pimeloyl-ACP methyl ester carboxylesterase